MHFDSAFVIFWSSPKKRKLRNDLYG